MPWRTQDISEPEQEEDVATQAKGAVEQSIITPKLTQGLEDGCDRVIATPADSMNENRLPDPVRTVLLKSPMLTIAPMRWKLR